MARDQCGRRPVSPSHITHVSSADHEDVSQLVLKHVFPAEAVALTLLLQLILRGHWPVP